MSTPIINDLVIDDENSEEFARHGISDRQVLQVLDNFFTAPPNRKFRRGYYLMIGRDNGGTCIAIPIEPTRQSDVWRPITAWLCKPDEEIRLNRG